MTKGSNDKKKYEAPVIVPLGELAVSRGACSFGSVAETGSCSSGGEADPACNSGGRAKAACGSGDISQQAACSDGGIPNTQCNDGGQFSS